MRWRWRSSASRAASPESADELENPGSERLRTPPRARAGRRARGEASPGDRPQESRAGLASLGSPLLARASPCRGPGPSACARASRPRQPSPTFREEGLRLLKASSVAPKVGKDASVMVPREALHEAIGYRSAHGPLRLFGAGEDDVASPRRPVTARSPRAAREPGQGVPGFPRNRRCCTTRCGSGGASLAGMLGRLVDGEGSHHGVGSG